MCINRCEGGDTLVCMRCVYPCFYHIYVVCHVIGKLSMRVLEGVKIGSGWAFGEVSVGP